MKRITAQQARDLREDNSYAEISKKILKAAPNSNSILVADRDITANTISMLKEDGFKFESTTMGDRQNPYSGFYIKW